MTSETENSNVIACLPGSCRKNQGAPSPRRRALTTSRRDTAPMLEHVVGRAHGEGVDGESRVDAAFGRVEAGAGDHQILDVVGLPEAVANGILARMPHHR